MSPLAVEISSIFKKVSMNRLNLICFYMLLPLFAFSQVVNDHTISIDSSFQSPNAKIEEVEWIAGHWRGEAWGGILEEVWTPPLGNSMMGSFKMVSADTIQFYELLTINELENSLVLQLKHFYGNLHGWEEKDKTLKFRLVKLEEKTAYFAGFTFELESEDKLNVYVLFKQDDGSREEMKFSYTRWDGDNQEKNDNIKGLRTASYCVSDLNKAKEWYSKAFDTTPYFDEPFYVGFNISGYELGLLPKEQTNKIESVVAYWAVDNINTHYDRLIELGAKNHEEPNDVGDGIMVAVVKDPWDNLIGLIYNPYFKAPN